MKITTNTISTKQLREDFSLVINAMASGQSLTLLYRSRPLAKIKPIPQYQPQDRNFSTRQLNQWIKNDRLSSKEQVKANELINHLP